MRPVYRLTVLLAGVCVLLSACMTDEAHALPSSRTAHAGGIGARVASAAVIQTTADLRDALTPMPPLPFTSSPAEAAALITVNDSVRYQTITGFGGAMTDTSAWLLYHELSPSERTAAMNALFGEGGINIDFVRIPMGASDFTVSGVPYSYDDLPAGRRDPTLARFSVAHDESYIIPALRAMLVTDPQIRTIANPWSPPPWMKANDAFDDLGYFGIVLPTYYPSLAEYFVKFIDAYGARGVPIDAITPMNEPTSEAPFPSTNFVSAESSFILGDLEPSLAAAGLHPAIYGLDDIVYGGWYEGIGSDVDDALSPHAVEGLAGIALHCYRGMGGFTAVHDEYPSKELILDECSPGITPYATAEVAIDATDNWASAVALWNLALDRSGGPVAPPNHSCHGCTGIITVSERTHTFTLKRNYYELGQASRYIQPGAVHIAATRLVRDFLLGTAAGGYRYGVSAGLDDAAFENPDGSKVLLAYDNSSTPVLFAVAWHHEYLSYRLAARATVTLVWH